MESTDKKNLNNVFPAGGKCEKWKIASILLMSIALVTFVTSLLLSNYYSDVDRYLKTFWKIGCFISGFVIIAGGILILTNHLLFHTTIPHPEAQIQGDR